MSPAAPRRGLSRRTFLKLGVAGAAGAAGAAVRAAAWRLSPAALAAQTAQTAPRASVPRIGAARPLRATPVPHELFSDPDSLLERSLAGFDLLLLPAYIAATLICRGALQPAGGPPGRAHDPEGTFTIPDSYQIAYPRYLAGASSAGASPTIAASWSELQQAPGQVLVPRSPRLALSAALLSRGCSPNDTHAGHLAQAGDDLAWFSASGPAGSLAIILADLPLTSGARLPLEGVPLIEYDWVIPAAANAALAQAFLRRRAARPPVLPLDPGVHAIPLMPLPEAARRQQAGIWSALAQARA